MTKNILKYQFLQSVDFNKLTNWSVKYLLEGLVQYNENYALVKIGSFLKRSKEQIEIQDADIYKRVTIKINNGGVYLRDQVKGVNIGTKNQFIIRKGQFLLSKIDARNGAFGVVPEEVDNAIITGNFWTYNVDMGKVNPTYLSLITTTKQFVAFCQRSSAGTTNRHYLQEHLFLNEKIPLPSLEEQQSLVDAYQMRVAEAQRLELEAKKLHTSIDEKLGIITPEITKSKPGSLSFIDFVRVAKWGLDQLFNSVTNYDTFYTVVSVQSLCSVGSGGTPSRSIARYYKGEIPWVKTGEVVDDVIYDTEEKITLEAIQNSSAKLYPKGSLLVAMYGQGKTRGRTAKLGVDATTNQACAVLYDINHDQILTDYLWVYLMNEYERLRSLASGNNQPNLNADMVKTYPVVLPPKHIQEQIVNYYFSLKENIRANSIQAEVYRNEAFAEFEKSVFQIRHEA